MMPGTPWQPCNLDVFLTNKPCNIKDYSNKSRLPKGLMFGNLDLHFGNVEVELFL